jgi:poly [ADP-ribose] polymerase
MTATLTDGTRYAYLIMVTNANNNKYYEMKGNASGPYENFTSTYGRVDKTGTSRTYGGGNWDKLYNSKLKKGYKDVTQLHLSPATNQQSTIQVEHNDIKVRRIFEYLYDAANGALKQAYSGSIQNVTHAMIREAQGHLNELADLLQRGQWSQFNRTLLELYQVIPRQMAKVQSHLLNTQYGDDDAKTAASSLLGIEQDLLQTLSGQVTVNQVKDDVPQTDLLSLLGLDAYGINTQQEKYIKQMMGDVKDSYHSAVAVVNKTTRQRFTDWVNKSKDKTVKDLWHGSRSENWTSIMQSGLVLYPTSAVITGKMFGYGLYFAPLARKSGGYTSLRGSHWTNGDSNRGYIALYQVHTGDSWYPNGRGSYEQVKEKDMLKKGKDSLWARASRGWLYNDEVIVYNHAQCDLQYIVEIR